jgi:hypothetical protein
MEACATNATKNAAAESVWSCPWVGSATTRRAGMKIRRCVATASPTVNARMLGLWWSLGGAGFPFGSGSDPDAALSILKGVRPATGAPVIVALGLAGAVSAVAMARGLGPGILRAALLALAWTVAAVLALAIPDYRVLVGVAYAPIILIGAPFGWPPGVSILDVFPWPVANQFLCIAGGFLWAATSAAYGRRNKGACE